MTEQSWQTSFAREADNVKALSENNAHLRAALVKAEEERDEAITQAVLELHNQLYPVIAQRDAQLAAAERTVREQREAIVKAKDVLASAPGHVPQAIITAFAILSASLPPVADERTTTRIACPPLPARPTEKKEPT